MKVKNVLLSLFFFAMSSFAHGGVWLFEDVTIEDVAFLHSSGTTAVIIKLSDTSNPTQPYSCDATSGRQVVAFWGDQTSNYTQSMLSIAMSAQAQDLKVDINVDTNSCSTSSRWWDGNAPHGIGLKLRGIRINKQ